MGKKLTDYKCIRRHQDAVYWTLIKGTRCQNEALPSECDQWYSLCSCQRDSRSFGSIFVAAFGWSGPLGAHVVQLAVQFALEVGPLGGVQLVAGAPGSRKSARRHESLAEGGVASLAPAGVAAPVHLGHVVRQAKATLAKGARLTDARQRRLAPDEVAHRVHLAEFLQHLI